MDKRLVVTGLIRAIALGTITVATDCFLPEGMVQDLVTLGAGVVVNDFLLRPVPRDVRVLTVLTGFVHAHRGRASGAYVVVAPSHETSVARVGEVTQ
ncbi:hypothetical protein [Streptomyces triculaminicus]|uniref:hypothetical protein n=1 Tax=Streptomyces triculaminicus TaxID=2816232 RepID=UPI00379DBFBD